MTRRLTISVDDPFTSIFLKSPNGDANLIVEEEETPTEIKARRIEEQLNKIKNLDDGPNGLLGFEEFVKSNKG